MYSSNIQISLDDLENNSGFYKSLLQSLIVWIDNHQKEQEEKQKLLPKRKYTRKPKTTPTPIELTEEKEEKKDD
jgi:hypothetical protein